MIVKTKIRVPIFDADLPFTFFTEAESPAITKNMQKNIAGLQVFSSTELELIKGLLFEDCRSACELIDYGFNTIDGKTLQDSNLIGLGISDKDIAFEKSAVSQVVMDYEDEEFPNRYYAIEFSVPWEQEHGCSIIVKNDYPVAAYENSPYFGWYEKGGKYYKKIKDAEDAPRVKPT